MARRTAKQIAAAKRARERRLERVHHMTIQQYEDLKDYQGGVCYLCRWAKGKTKALAVDHDHKRAEAMCNHDPHKESCINCWRGLLCSACNGILRTARDTVEFFKRGIEYLTRPPARRFFHGE